MATSIPTPEFKTNKIKVIDKKIQTLNDLFREFGTNPEEFFNIPKLSGLVKYLNNTDEVFLDPESKPEDDATGDFLFFMNELKDKLLDSIHKNLGGINLADSSPEITVLKQSKQTLYNTLIDLNKKLNDAKNNLEIKIGKVLPNDKQLINKKIDDITSILKLIPFAKTSFLTEPQIDNPIRHKFSTTLYYINILRGYETEMDISYSPISGQKRIELFKKNPTSTLPVPIKPDNYIHSVFSEESFIDGTKKYQIRENLASFAIVLNYEYDYDYFNDVIFFQIPHYIGDETTVPQDLQNIFKYIFWFQQKIKTCDVPFFPSVLTMMKMLKGMNNLPDPYIDKFIEDLEKYNDHKNYKTKLENFVKIILPALPALPASPPPPPPLQSLQSQQRKKIELVLG